MNDAQVLAIITAILLAGKRISGEGSLDLQVATSEAEQVLMAAVEKAHAKRDADSLREEQK